MSFDVAAERYDRFMGRYSRRLSPLFADFAHIAAGDRVIDVGSGPGALTSELVARVGADHVVAVDPSEPFVAALRDRYPGVTAVHAYAEALPFGDALFDAALAQLVVHVMADSVRGLAEMIRVTRRDGVVAACVWDYGGGQDPLRIFWRATHEIDPGTVDESGLAGVGEGQLVALFESAGLRDVEAGELWVHVEHADFDAWWEPFTFGVGPAGAHLAKLTAEQREAIQARCRELLGKGPVEISALAWAAAGRR